MTAHIAIPKVLEAPDLPATLSKRLLTDILRKRLGFEGIVITDGLEMQGIVKNMEVAKLPSEPFSRALIWR